MDELPYEIIEYVGKYLSILDIAVLRSTCLAFYNALTVMYRKRLSNVRWKINTHILFYPFYNDFTVEKVIIILGYCKNMEHRHERCSHCMRDSDYLPISNDNGHLLYTVVEKGNGGPILDQIIANMVKTNRGSVVPVSVTKHENFDITTTITGPYFAEVYIGDLDHKFSNIGVIKYGIHGSIPIDTCYDNIIRTSENDLGDYDLSRYRDGVFMEDNYYS